jgi:hypothetical protein
MKNVAVGIVFEGEVGADYFSYTTVDDVRISLDKREDAVGIKVGAYVNLFGAFIKATVWLGEIKQVGLDVYGSLRYSLVNLEIEQESPPDQQELVTEKSGKGVVINSGAVVCDNQSFMLTTLIVDPDRRVCDCGSFGHDIVWRGM